MSRLRRRGRSNDADQVSSDADQVSSDADQVSSDADQDLADEELARQAAPSAAERLRHAESRRARESCSDERDAATVDRAGVSRARTEGRTAPTAPGPSGSEVLQLEQLRRALDQGSFELFAQPIVELSTDTTVQHELLIRMVDEHGGLLAPGAFIPTAERFGLISELDHWVIRRAVEIAARGYPVQINISGGTLADPDLGAFTEHALATAGAAPFRLGLEITETALIGNEGVANRFFERVRALGCGVAIDDFGTGFAGFRYLKEFVVDSLKIDREFIADIVSAPASAKVVHSIVDLASEFDLKTVAEGVEDRATLDRVRACGVDYAQGYLFAKPAPATEVLRGEIGAARAVDDFDLYPYPKALPARARGRD